MNTRSEGLLSVMLGAITGLSFGSMIFQAIGVLLLGAIGAMGGWAFEKIIKPKLEKLLKKKEKDEQEAQ